MRNELIVAIVMFLISIGGSIATKNDKKWSVLFLFIAALAGSLVAGMGVRFREIVEGPFGFLDSMLCVCAASVLVAVLDRSGAFVLLYSKISKVRFGVLRAFLILFFIALPSMLTGFATSSLLTTGKLVRNLLEKQGEKKAPVIVAVGAFLGVLLPPNCIPAIIAANGAGSVLPTPYSGFFLPLLVVALPAFIVYALMEYRTLASLEEADMHDRGASAALAVLAIVMVAVIIEGVFSSFIWLGGNTLVFFVAALLVLVLSRFYGSAKETLDVVSDGLMKAVVPMAIVFALGSFIEVSSMTGVRGMFSYWILGYSTTAVMLVLMAASLIIGYFFSIPIPAFLITYAVFPIGWLANTVIVTGCSVVLAVIGLVTRRGGIMENNGLKRTEVLKNICVPAFLVLVMGVLLVVFGDKMTFLIM
ncbi:MAG: TRAP transporter large permease subunit [Spirochaetales bacterium]|nr:TRAP transporter large permease subunit [Spirochaetales bacterium]